MDRIGILIMKVLNPKNMGSLPLMFVIYTFLKGVNSTSLRGLIATPDWKGASIQILKVLGSSFDFKKPPTGPRVHGPLSPWVSHILQQSFSLEVVPVQSRMAWTSLPWQCGGKQDTWIMWSIMWWMQYLGDNLGICAISRSASTFRVNFVRGGVSVSSHAKSHMVWNALN